MNRSRKGTTAPSLLPLRTAILLAILLGLLWLVGTQRGAIREHHLYFTETRSDVVLPLSELSEAWTEQRIRDRFPGIPLRCGSNPGPDLGDLGCALDTKSFNGVPALYVSFFFTAGHLQQLSINVPWWEHETAYDQIVSTYGSETAAQPFPFGGVRLFGWSLPDGAAIFLNRDRSQNPLEWNAIYWRSASACERISCFSANTR